MIKYFSSNTWNIRDKWSLKEVEIKGRGNEENRLHFTTHLLKSLEVKNKYLSTINYIY